jgi:hypothetical protein
MRPAFASAEFARSNSDQTDRLAGQLSEGMLFDLGYADGITPVLAMPERPVPNGARRLIDLHSAKEVGKQTVRRRVQSRIVLHQR